MAKLKIKLEENHLLLIKNFKFKIVDDSKVFLDSYSPYGGDYLIEDLALFFGKLGEFLPGTENSYGGKHYGYDVEESMLVYHRYIVDNISHIISLMVEFVETGLKPGTYSCIDYKLDWKYSEK